MIDPNIAKMTWRTFAGVRMHAHVVCLALSGGREHMWGRLIADQPIAIIEDCEQPKTLISRQCGDRKARGSPIERIPGPGRTRRRQWTGKNLRRAIRRKCSRARQHRFATAGPSQGPIGLEHPGQYRFAGWRRVLAIGHVVAASAQQQCILRAKWSRRIRKCPGALGQLAPIVKHLGGIGVLIGIPWRHETGDGKLVWPSRQWCRRTGGYLWRYFLDRLGCTLAVRRRQRRDPSVQAGCPGDGLTCAMTDSADVAEAGVTVWLEMHLIAESVLAQRCEPITRLLKCKPERRFV